jgi:uncharacterized membrane protein
VTAPVLLAIFDTIYLFALTAWVGSILFFSFAVAPIIFQVLGAESGGKFVRALFPRYYLWGVISCSVALPALICGTLSFPELRGPMVGIQAFLILLSLLIMLYCGHTLTPAINSARDQGPASSDRFNRLHKRSVHLNVIVLLIGLGLLVAFATRRVPRTQGIVEPSPGEAVRRQV